MSSAQKQGTVKSLSANIKTFIDENYKGSISIKVIADNFFISPSTACQYFKNDYNISIKKYINEKRMLEAKKLIEKGENFKSISSQLGFKNYSTFFRAYKKHFGASPSKKTIKLLIY